MELLTPVAKPRTLPQISYGNHLMIMGSCFAQEIGGRMADARFNCLVNPYGTLYNPLSISHAIEELLTDRLYEPADLFQSGGLWHSFSHHGSFSMCQREAALAHMNDSLLQARQFMLQADWLMLTFGTAWVYYHSGRVVANCHKLPEREFVRRRIDTSEVVEAYEHLLSLLPPTVKLLLTVSPIRHIRDGLHENQLSKATLLLAVDQLQQRHPGRVFYFPAYEIVLDELRDYRFYADDMVHPSPLAAEYVWQRFLQWCMTKQTLTVIESVNKVKKMLGHTPLHPDGPEYAAFLNEIVLKIEKLSDNWPYFDLSKEKEQCLTKLNILRR